MVVGAKLNSKRPFIVDLTRQILEVNIKDIKVTTARDFSTPVIFHSFAQRVLNDLWRTRLSCRIINWLLPPPSPPSSVSKLSLCLSLQVGGGGMEQNQQPGPL
jgi:hypothetical protein